MLTGDRSGFLPCTPAGVQEMLKRAGVATSGKHCVIVGRSNIVGKPMAALMMQPDEGANCTVTVCHSGTRDLGAETRRADILIAATGEGRTHHGGDGEAGCGCGRRGDEQNSGCIGEERNAARGRRRF